MKFYLKCEHCGHRNEVNSEFLTFCDSCNKKLNLNFRDWQKKHRDATLDDYKAQVCESEEIVAKEINERKANQVDGWKHWIGISKTLAVILGVILFILPVYLNIQDLNYSLEASAYANVSFDPKWENRVFGSFGLSADSPFELSQSSLPIPDVAKSYIEMSESFQGGLDKEPFLIMLNSIKYLPSVGELDMEGAANGSAQAMKNAPGVSDFTYNQEQTSISGINGFRQDGSYYQNGVKMTYTYLGVGQDLVMWQVIVAHAADIAVYEKAAERVLNSIYIQYSLSN